MAQPSCAPYLHALRLAIHADSFFIHGRMSHRVASPLKAARVWQAYAKVGGDTDRSMRLASEYEETDRARLAKSGEMPGAELAFLSAPEVAEMVLGRVEVPACCASFVEALRQVQEEETAELNARFQALKPAALRAEMEAVFMHRVPAGMAVGRVAHRVCTRRNRQLHAVEFDFNGRNNFQSSHIAFDDMRLMQLILAALKELEAGGATAIFDPRERVSHGG